jgi:hypothetical protein
MRPGNPGWGGVLPPRLPTGRKERNLNMAHIDIIRQMLKSLEERKKSTKQKNEVLKNGGAEIVEENERVGIPVGK